MPNKQQITQRLIEQLGDTSHLDVESAMGDWWQDWRTDKGLRLTTEGRDVFDQLKYESYSFEIPAHIAIVSRNLLILETLDIIDSISPNYIIIDVNKIIIIIVNH